MDDESFGKFLNNKILLTLIPSSGCILSLLFLIFVVMLTVLIKFGFIKTESNDVTYNCVDIKSAEEICSSVIVNGQNYSVDDYVAGVISAEVGGFDSYSNGIEVMKANAITARTYALNTAKKTNGVCNMGNASEASQAFASASEGAKTAAKETSGMILVDENGSPGFTEYSSVLLTNSYDSFGSSVTFSENNGSLSVPKNWADNYILKYCPRYTGDKGVNVFRSSYGGYGCGHGHGMSQVGALYLASEKGYTYEQILDYYYTDDGFSLASTDGGGKKCTTSYNGSFQPLDHYTLTHEGLKVLNHKLTDSEVNSLNSDLQAALDYAGHGTGEAVASVGQALVYWFEKQGVYLQYRWGGGHDYPTNAGCDLQGSFVFANPNWGSSSCGYDEHDSSRVYYGMDCSGFVSWATRTACNPKFGANVSDTWVNYGDHISLSEAQPGDVIADGEHIQLVIKNNGDGTVYVAEEGGSSGNVGSGLVFSLITAASNRPDYVISMKDWYSKNCVDIHAGNGGSSSSSGKGKILLIAGHSYSPYCDKAENECRGIWEGTGYAEETETRTLVKLLKQKLINQGYKSSEVDIANELLGEKFSDTSTSKSLYVEIVNDTAAFHNIDFSKYEYAIEIHFNGSDSHTASGVCSVCTNGDCGISSSINSKVRSAVSDVLGKYDNGVCNIDTHTFNFFKEKGIPFTYLETEFYDNKSAMDYYSSNKEAVAEAIAKVIRANYP